MIDFHKITPEDRERYQQLLLESGERGCEFSFANLYLWGRQRIAFVEEHAVLFSQFDRKTVYPFPVGGGDKRAALDAIIADSRERGVSCRVTGLTGEHIQLMQELYPDRFYYHCDRGAYDYVYAIDDLADLKGRKYQKKRNFYNRFRANFPHYEVHPLTDDLLPAVQAMVDGWYEARMQADPEADLLMERAALNKALQRHKALGMETLVLTDGDQVIAMTMGSFLSEDTVDVHFEKAREDVDGAYPTINCEFARYLRNKYPQLRYLNREEDMGLEGLRKAKESYYPHHMTEKCWAHLKEDGYDY
jgi:hypothetical protein